jgi:hypothetical protein
VKTASAKTPLENSVIYGENASRIRGRQENYGKHAYVSSGKIPRSAKTSGKRAFFNSPVSARIEETGKNCPPVNDANGGRIKESKRGKIAI